MKVIKSIFNDVLVLKSERYNDERGFFLKVSSVKALLDT